MSERWAGFVIGSDTVTIVDAEVPDTGALTVQMDDTWDLQSGDRATAYVVMQDRIENYLREHGIARAVVKASAINTGGTKLVHLKACELRGVVMAAAARIGPTECVAKAHMSRTFGSRKVDEYVQDGAFWSKEINGKLRIGSREAAMILLAARKSA